MMLPSALQMVLTIKLSSFAYNVWDGRKWAEIEKDTGDKKKDRSENKKRRNKKWENSSVVK